MSERHKWIERERLDDRTRRQCDKCGLWKITRHEPAARPQHWIEWYRADGSRVPGDATPACEPVSPSVHDTAQRRVLA